MNESIYYNIDKLHTAIGEGKQIRFQYFQWTVEKKEALRRDGGWYCVSPWHLRWDDENYYLIAYDAEADRVKHYRVDKMKRITLLEAPRLGQSGWLGLTRLYTPSGCSECTAVSRCG